MASRPRLLALRASWPKLSPNHRMHWSGRSGLVYNGASLAVAQWSVALAQVKELGIIFGFFGYGNGRKSNGDGAEFVRMRCSEDLLG